MRDSYPPNPWGLHHMDGNVWEWVENRDARNSEGRSSVLPDNESRVVRCGAWGSEARNCHAAGRFRSASDHRFNYIGFRVYRGSPIESLPVDPLNTVQPKR